MSSLTSAPFATPVTLRMVALIGYPVLILAALWLEEPGIRSAGLPLLAIALVGLWPRHPAGRLILAISLVLAVAVLLNPALALWPPGLICLTVAAFFALSLRPGRRPLIERFAAAIHESQGRTMPGDSDRWMRRWTAYWAVLLSVIGLVSITLATADLALAWLIWMVGIVPLLAIGSLLAEYQLRRKRFPHHDHWPLGQFLKLLSHIRPEQLVR